MSNPRDTLNGRGESAVIHYLGVGTEVFCLASMAILFAPFWIPFVALGWAYERLFGPLD